MKAVHSTIGEILSKTARRLPDKTAIICDDKTITFHELDSGVNRCAHAFLKKGIKKKQKVAVLCSNSIELVEVFFALAKIGCVTIPLNYRLSGTELSFILEDANSAALIVGEEFNPLVDELKSRLNKIDFMITIGQELRESDQFSPNQPDHEPEIDVKTEDESFIIYTSGTTGRPRGVVLTHANHFFNTLNYTNAYQMEEGDVELALSPMFHSSTLGRIVTYVFNGVTFITSHRFDPEKALKLINKHRVTSITQSPTMYAALLDVSVGDLCSTDSVKRIVSGAAPLFPAIRKRLTRMFPRAGIYDLYGLTEASPGVSILKPDDPPDKVLSVGKPMEHVSIKIVDDEGNEVPPGKSGDIVCNGPNIMKGYYNDLPATQEVLRDGWLYTGDMGKMDRDGYLYLTGRKKELIVRGGENIYPAEVEAVLHQHPDIQEAVVIGIPDEYWGETVKALVVLQPGVTLTEEEVVAFCTPQLAPFKRPTSVAFLSSLPKNAAGKVMKIQLLIESTNSKP
jgi:acyl-CoA synthetase (AMP-forming)/AMP-acid ligase II